MEEGSTGKRRWVQPFDPNAATYAAFYRKYMGFLLPALIRAAGGRKTTQMEKIVRFEVDMALVSSAGDFKWSRALKHELEEGKNADNFPICQFDIIALSAIPRPIVLVDAHRPREDGRRIMRKGVARGEEEELACRIRILCRIMPGGGEMSVFDLLSEVESYVVCLRLQVGALRSLVGAQ